MQKNGKKRSSGRSLASKAHFDSIFDTFGWIWGAILGHLGAILGSFSVHFGSMFGKYIYLPKTSAAPQTICPKDRFSNDLSRRPSGKQTLGQIVPKTNSGAHRSKIVQTSQQILPTKPSQKKGAGRAPRGAAQLKLAISKGKCS